MLDVATNAGGFAIEAARSGAAEVVGTDIVEHYLEQANFLRRALDLSNVSFRRQAIESISPEGDGVFDLVFCFDILYHLENPVLAMRKLSEVTDKMMVVETRVSTDPDLKGPSWLMNVLPPSKEGASIDRPRGGAPVRCANFDRRRRRSRCCSTYWASTMFNRQAWATTPRYKTSKSTPS